MISSRGIEGRLVSVTLKERGAPSLARATRIASAATFELGAICAQFHYYRLANSRRLDARAAQRPDTEQSEEKDVDTQD